MNTNKLSGQERRAWASRLGWTTYQVRHAVKALGGPGQFREAAKAGTLPEPGIRQKPRPKSGGIMAKRLDDARAYWLRLQDGLDD